MELHPLDLALYKTNYPKMLMFRVPGFHEVVYKDRVLQAKGYRSGIFLNSNLEIEDNFFNTFIFLVQLRSRRRSIMRILCLYRYIVKQL